MKVNQKTGAGNKPQPYDEITGEYLKATNRRVEKAEKINLNPKLIQKLKELTRKRKKQDIHLEKWTEPPTFTEQMKKYLGVSEIEAEKFVNALSNWTDGIYSQIREAQYNDDVLSEGYQLAMLLEEYIQKAPKWSGKPIYRGLKLTQEQIDEYNVGSVFNMRGLSSWTSEKTVANFFASRNKKENEKEVLLINNNGTNKGTSITHLAKYKEQFEVLVSYEAIHVVTKKYNQVKYTIMEIEEKTYER